MSEDLSNNQELEAARLLRGVSDLDLVRLHNLADALLVITRAARETENK